MSSRKVLHLKSGFKKRTDHGKGQVRIAVIHNEARVSEVYPAPLHLVLYTAGPLAPATMSSNRRRHVEGAAAR